VLKTAKKLSCEQSSIDGYATGDLLSRTSNLRSSIYEVDINMPYDVVFAPDVMAEALEKYAAHSLGGLQLVVKPDWLLWSRGGISSLYARSRNCGL
jgi:hypothetical protein